MHYSSERLCYHYVSSKYFFQNVCTISYYFRSFLQVAKTTAYLVLIYWCRCRCRFPLFGGLLYLLFQVPSMAPQVLVRLGNYPPTESYPLCRCFSHGSTLPTWPQWLYKAFFMSSLCSLPSGPVVVCKGYIVMLFVLVESKNNLHFQ